MALNRFSAGTVTRSKGQSIAARASYKARESLKDGRMGDSKDYRYKDRVEFQGIFTPTKSPSWAKDRSQLWNEVEKREHAALGGR
jgi:hypothetical protein